MDQEPPRGMSADARAVKVMNDLNWTPARLRGAVAHSQGGLVAASLLENFSWIFYDNAVSRPPNVVSMGSPYNGTYMGDQSNSTLGRLIKLFTDSVAECVVPYDLKKSRNNEWSRHINWRAKTQIVAYFTTHHKSYWYKHRDCGWGSLKIRGSDDGVAYSGEGQGFVTGGEYNRRYSGHCHTSKLGKDQWDHPEFVTKVNQLFWSDKEDWQFF